MSSLSIIYFSGTGNTEVVANLLSQNLSKTYTVDVFKVEDILKQKLKYESGKYDIIGIGYPIYGFNAPLIIYDFVNSLNISAKKKVFLFSTCAASAYINEVASYCLKRELTKKGYYVFYEKQFYIAPNFAIQYKDDFIKQLYNAAILRTKEMAEDIKLNKENARKDNFIPNLFRWIVISEKWWWWALGKDFRILKSCNLCQKCIKFCPRDNIYIKNNHIKFKWNCIACYRCVYSCPNKAIAGRLYNFAIFKNGYNIRKIIENDQLKGNYLPDKIDNTPLKTFDKYLFQTFSNYLHKD
ncbi:MAG: EFR1 family ferrodoxin [bacterium]|nr:EFR1 family ferrodoxin [bacterium]